MAFVLGVVRELLRFIRNPTVFVILGEIVLLSVI